MEQTCREGFASKLDFYPHVEHMRHARGSTYSTSQSAVPRRSRAVSLPLPWAIYQHTRNVRIVLGAAVLPSPRAIVLRR